MKIFLVSVSVLLVSIAVSPKAYTVYKSRLDYAVAEARVETLIADKWTSVDFEDLKNLTTIPPRVRDIKRLQSVRAKGTKIDDLSPLEGLPYLKSIYVGDTRIDDLSPLATSNRLEVLHIGRTWVFDLEPLANLPRLRRLQMDRLAVRTICPLQDLQWIQWVNLYKSYANDGSQECFKQLNRYGREIAGGNSYRQNYIPGAPYKFTVAFDRFLKYWEWR